MKNTLLLLLGLYRRWLSPAIHGLSPDGCKFRPTCSEYAVEAITLYGAARGCLLALKRLARCHPFTSGGFDPVPTLTIADEHGRQPLP